MKYHFFPIQSILGSWKNSMNYALLPQRYLTPGDAPKFPYFLYAEGFALPSS